MNGLSRHVEAKPSSRGGCGAGVTTRSLRNTSGIGFAATLMGCLVSSVWTLRQRPVFPGMNCAATFSVPLGKRRLCMATNTCICCGAACRKLYCLQCNNYDPKRARAYAIVRRAVLSGALPRALELTCVDCGAPAEHYDHRDYHEPLTVVPVCRSCNFRRGPAKQPFSALGCS